MQPLPNRVCPLCQGDNACAPARTGRFDAGCWCQELRIPADVLRRVPPDEVNRACVCPRCAGVGAVRPRG